MRCIGWLYLNHREITHELRRTGAAARQLFEQHFRTIKEESSDLERLMTVVTAEPVAYGVTEKDLKRLDKAVVLVKVGAKIVKKVALRELKRAARCRSKRL